MAKVYLICGKICSGKTWYTNRLKTQVNAVVLSCDELVFALFDGQLGDKHDAITDRIRRYFLTKAAEIVLTGTNVILEWGFWAAAYRQEVLDYFRCKHVECELHYIDVSDAKWKMQIEKRNEDIRNGLSDTYIVDDGLLKKLERFFEMPSRDEVDVWVNNG